MPYPNLHSFRLKDPGLFKRLRTKKITKGVTIIVGVLKSKPKGSSVVQAYRFDKQLYSFTKAKQWMGKHKITYRQSEKAKPTLEDVQRELGDILLTRLRDRRCSI